ncbi:MAG: hypothetical protein KGH98_03800 [Candidatus Micrarchaeota archaeon]|nr:hypothetical protein [Candidatus Micrarchaeota archaeon]
MSKTIPRQLDNKDKRLLRDMTELKGFQYTDHIAHVSEIPKTEAERRLKRLTSLGYTEKYINTGSPLSKNAYQVLEQGQIVAHLLEAADLLQRSDKGIAGDVNRIVDKFTIKSED